MKHQSIHEIKILFAKLKNHEHLTVIKMIWIVFAIAGFVGGRNFYYMHAIVFPVANTQYYFEFYF